MSGFSVSLDTLAGASEALRDSLGVIGEWDGRKRALATAGESAGSPVMTDAIRRFADEWAFGFELLAGDIEGLASTIDQAGQAYADTEAAIVASTGG